MSKHKHTHTNNLGSLAEVAIATDVASEKIGEAHKRLRVALGQA